MNEKIFETKLGIIHYWVNLEADNKNVQLVFLPGLTANHKLFEKQINYFEGKYQIIVWDAPGHSSSWPFELSFSLKDKARWLNEILIENGFEKPIIVGQSMGGYLGQMYCELYPETISGFISIDSAPLQRRYMTNIEIWLLKRMEPVYLHYPWKTLVRQGVKYTATSDYGRRIMYNTMMEYDGDKNRYAALAGGGYRILADAIEENLKYEIKCPAILICGKKDRAGSCIRYNKAWHRETNIPIYWIEGAGHNSNTDRPEVINHIIEEFVENIEV